MPIEDLIKKPTTAQPQNLRKAIGAKMDLAAKLKNLKTIGNIVQKTQLRLYKMLIRAFQLRFSVLFWKFVCDGGGPHHWNQKVHKVKICTW